MQHGKNIFDSYNIHYVFYILYLSRFGLTAHVTFLPLRHHPKALRI